jgi:signal transduction histidine kinase
LISNAIKYSPEGGAIIIQLRRQKPTQLCQLKLDPEVEVLHFSIQDQGIGIPLEQQTALFERFYRANNSRDSGLPGLGLGLYISSQIISLHGGRMWVESAGEGQGSTFHFVLPA